MHRPRFPLSGGVPRRSASAADGASQDQFLSANTSVFDRRAHVVEHDQAVKAAIRRILTADGIYSEEFSCAEEFLDGHETRQPACIIANFVLPRMGGLELLQHLRRTAAADPVILISDVGDVAAAVAAVRAGALDVIERNALEDRLLDSITRAFEQVRTAQLNGRAHGFDALSPRERQVLLRLSDGAPSQIVAENLGLSVRTVEMHRANVLRKLGVKNIMQAVLRAKDAGLF